MNIRVKFLKEMRSYKVLVQCSQPKKLKQIITKAPMVADPVAMGVTKVPLEFKEKVLDKAFDKSMGKTYNETKFTREVGS